MGCFISCFRGRDRDRGSRSLSAPISTDSNFLHENLVTKDPQGLGFQSEEKETQDILVDHDLLNDQLRQEAAQLKLCGVITQTPPEIKKSHKRRAFQELNGSDPSSKSPQTASNKKSPLSAKSEQENRSENEKQILNSKENTPAAGSNEGIKGAKLDSTPAQHFKTLLTGPNIKSPYPTPLTLRDDMETPATAFPSSYMATPRTSKRARIRSQFIFPASKQQQEISSPSKPDQQAEKQLDLSSGVKTGEEKQLEVSGGVKTAEKNQMEISSAVRTGEEETPKTSVASLSEWLKPLGIRNGIPNTTTKYKEDQKVKWHATPFEERLEKVLSEEEKMLPRKQVVPRLIELEEE